MAAIHYLAGDATAPLAEGNKIIAHVCNDAGRWGKGFVVALSKRWLAPEAAYRDWWKNREEEDFALGGVQLVPVEKGVFVANMIGQHGVGVRAGVAPIRYEAVAMALEQLANLAGTLDASVHMPRIGCGLAGGKWEEIEPLIQRILCAKAVEVYVYDLVSKVSGRRVRR